MNMAEGFDFYVHGLWILGTVFFVLGSMVAGNVEWIQGVTTTSYSLSVLIAFALLMVAGMCWISAAVNARQEERINHIVQVVQDQKLNNLNYRANNLLNHVHSKDTYGRFARR